MLISHPVNKILVLVLLFFVRGRSLTVNKLIESDEGGCISLADIFLTLNGPVDDFQEVEELSI